jgi:hypothetical protein
VKPSGRNETYFRMAQTQVGRKAILIGEETRETKLSISIILRVWTEFLRSTVGTTNQWGTQVPQSAGQPLGFPGTIASTTT